MKLSAHHISSPKPGEVVNGDAVVIRQDGDMRLIAVVDGLGHGERAREAAAAATDILNTIPLTSGVERIIRHVHEALRGTRGVAALVCVMGPSETSGGPWHLEGCSVGNVDMRFKVANVPMVLTPGVLGGRVERLKVWSASVCEGERFAVFSDGIAPRFHLRDLSSVSPSEACESIFSQHRRTHDDATILVADVVN
jgi:negative regulator of sigma-B (phosphoserine phosphatase)